MKFYADDWLTIYQGDVRAVLPSLPSDSVDCIVTSPPYWGLRDYGSEGQIGLERTPEEYVANMVGVFRELRRILKPSGTCWLNLGDSYAANGQPGQSNLDVLGEQYRGGGHKRAEVEKPRKQLPSGLKPKDLVGIPWRVAFALQQPYYTGQIPDERDRTWLAALMDGEGTFTILTTTSSSAGSISHPPIAQVRMTSQGVVQKAASLVGVASPEQRPPSMRGTRGVYQWRLSGGRAAAIARELYPYLIEKRQQALIAWNHQQVRDSYQTKRGVPMPAEARAKQQVCRDLIRRLNHGEHVDTPSWMVEPPTLTEPGWFLRSDVIWSKPNPMPESVTDRPTKAHEYLFLLTKSARYYYDSDAVREANDPANVSHHDRYSGRPSNGKYADPTKVRADKFTPNQGGVGYNPAGRNLRSVWTIATRPYPGAHFAVFPPELPERCIKAGSSERGVCPECGKPWERVVERMPNNDWQPTCKHPTDPYTRGFSNPPAPAVVLDPFAGSGTTGMMANRLSRRAILIDLNGDYLKQQLQRNAQTPLGLAG